jgi:hypothetical protein
MGQNVHNMFITLVPDFEPAVEQLWTKTEDFESRFDLLASHDLTTPGSHGFRSDYWPSTARDSFC